VTVLSQQSYEAAADGNVMLSDVSADGSTLPACTRTVDGHCCSPLRRGGISTFRLVVSGLYRRPCHHFVDKLS